MLDFDLAELYGYETRDLNRQIKRSSNKFPDDFMFQLTRDESKRIMMSQIVTARKWTVGNKGGRTSLPYAFAEQGIYMLMTILKGELAIKQSIAIIRLFKAMKDYIVETKPLLDSMSQYIEKFPDDFTFQLTNAELDKIVMSQIVISPNNNYFSGQGGGARKLPYAFTEQGLYMLTSVLKGEVAFRQSIAIIRLFKAMKIT